MTDASEIQNQYKVRLRVANEYTKIAPDVAERRRRSVSFNVTPDVTENRNVNYKTLDPLHMPGQIYVYGGTSSRTFQLSNIRLISRTTKEATDNMRLLHTLRGWTMPYFGNSSTLATPEARQSQQAAESSNGTAPTEKLESKQETGMELLGAPPDVLLLSAYSPLGEFAAIGSNSNKRRMTATNIHNVPCVITNLTIPYPSDVDYIPTDDNQPMPRMMTIDIQLAETHSPQEYNAFSIQDFRNGTLANF